MVAKNVLLCPTFDFLFIEMQNDEWSVCRDITQNHLCDTRVCSTASIKRHTHPFFIIYELEKYIVTARKVISWSMMCIFDPIFFSLMMLKLTLVLLFCLDYWTLSATKEQRFIFYDVNPGEGFNLRRDVFIRMAVMVHKLNLQSDKFSYVLVSFHLIAQTIDYY